MNDQMPGRAERGETPLPAGYAPGAGEEAPSGPEGVRWLDKKMRIYYYC